MAGAGGRGWMRAEGSGPSAAPGAALEFTPALPQSPQGSARPAAPGGQVGSLGRLGRAGRAEAGAGEGESQAPLQAARCTEGSGRRSRDNLEARQVELGGRPPGVGSISCSWQLFLGPWRVGLVLPGSGHLSESRRPWGWGGAAHGHGRCAYGHGEGECV